MTRDEAIEIIHGVTYPQTSCGEVGDPSFDRDRKWSEKIVDGLVALGILNLDEPKDEGFRKLMKATGYHPEGSVAGHIKKGLVVAGLKIVEK